MLRRFWERWKFMAHKIGNFQSRVLLNAFYFLVMMPFGLGVKVFSDPLRINLQSRSQWLHKDTPANRWEDARRQF